MKKKSKLNVVLYSIVMTIIFLVITGYIYWGQGATVFYHAIENYSRGYSIVSQAVLAVLIFIVMLLFKNAYVFNQKREKFTKGIFYGMYYIIGSIIFMLIFGIFIVGFSNGMAMLSLAIYCFLIGITEEFLCRGWLLNEFLERYGDTKKGVWYSIIISGIIFGLLHFGNVYTAGQNIYSTITQVFSAAAGGIVYGLIYYKTKNIWSVIFLHGLWDFSIMLGNIVPDTSTVEVINTFSSIGIICSFLVGVFELFNIIPYLKDIDVEPSKKSVIKYAIISFIGSLIFLLMPSYLGLGMEYGEKYTFGNINIDNYSVTRDNYSDYYINYTKANNNYNLGFESNKEREKYYFKLFRRDKNLVFTNLVTSYSIELECESLYDYIIMEEDRYYILAYIDYTGGKNNFLNYVYIQKSELSNSNIFMDNLKNGMKRYLLPYRSELLVVNSREDNISYLGAYNKGYGYYLLVDDNKMAILN